MSRRIALVLGGTRSGKSAVAERRAEAWSAGAPVTYVATARLDLGDAALAERVAAHRSRRPDHWRTVDAGDDLAAVLRATTGVVLLDALGPWVAAHHPAGPDADGLVEALRARDGDTVVVSDEVGLAVHPTTAAGRWFVDEMGRVNQAVAAVADEVDLVVAGRTLRLPPGEDAR